MHDNQKHYMGNPLLKRANIANEFTQEQLIELARCAADPVYFAKKYIKIVNIDDGLVPFDMWPFQEKMLRTFHENRFSICKLPRQCGKSTTAVSFLLHYAIFNDNVSIAILANKASTAKDLLGRLQVSFENLPDWMQQGIKSWNKTSLELENGSKIITASTSASSVRGGSYNIIFLDEFAFVPNTVAMNFMNSVYPTISSGKDSKVIVVSTPNGLNHFYKMWDEATKKENDYTPIEILWNDVPGRDEEWKKKTISNLGSEKSWLQEFESTSFDTYIDIEVDNIRKKIKIGDLYNEIK